MRSKSTRSARSGATPPASRKPAEVDPFFFDAFLREGRALLAKGSEAEAMDIAQRAVRLKETAESKALFVDCVKNWSYFPDAEQSRDVIARAVRAAWGKPQDFLGIAKGILSRDGVIGAALQRAAQAWPQRLPLRELFGPTGLAAVMSDSLLLALLENVIVPDLEFERLLTSIRAGLLDIATSDRNGRDERMQRFSAALARQCYINEYVFDLVEGEGERVLRLRDRIADGLDKDAAISPVSLAVLACYLPLGALRTDVILKRSWSQSALDVIDQQIRQPAEERRQRETIPSVTPIADATSVNVQGQYEEHPYPRWTRLPATVHSVPLDDTFRMEFPFSNFQDMGLNAGLDLLIAGCGTGHHSILFAQGFPNARTLAIDLSMSCLCYAKAKSLAMGLGNIEYAQADILELGSLGRTFDVISSSGVLHHLADPLRGWRTLLSLLRPKGCMHVGLYSELARRNIVAAQNWLIAQGYEAKPDDIRKARQALATADEPSLRQMTQSRDFYSMSECRDLLFPKQEQRFAIPQIQAFLENNGLEFLGFNVADNVRQDFRGRFSPQGEVRLDLWHQFETERPQTFIGMYQFWVQKRPPR